MGTNMRNVVRVAGIAALAAAASVAALVGAGASGAQEVGLDESCGFGEVIYPEENGYVELFCEIEVDKDLESGDPASLGSTVTFTITITNTGDVPLYNVGLTDYYDGDHLEFISATPAPDFGPEFDVLVWEELDESGGGSIWEPGDARTVTVRFEAVGVTGVEDSAENCALAYADPYLEYDILLDEVSAQENGEPYVISNESCADVVIEKLDEPEVPEDGPGAPDFPTPTAEPELPEPTPVVTVAPATVVPSPTRPAGIAAPDTGSGPGGGSGGAWLLASLAGAAMAVAAGGIYLGKRAS